MGRKRKIKPGLPVIYHWGGREYLGKVVSREKGKVRINHAYRVDVLVPANRIN